MSFQDRRLILATATVGVIAALLANANLHAQDLPVIHGVALTGDAATDAQGNLIPGVTVKIFRDNNSFGSGYGSNPF